VGVYLTSSEPMVRGAAVMLTLASEAHRMAVAQGVIGRRRPLLKIIAALAGDRVCRRGLAVSINGHSQVWARRIGHAGRPLPSWQGCRVLRPHEVFILGTHRDSFDGRYFGVVATSDLVARVVPVWLF
jgi:conjugative transfer signal peptidase TraF